MDQFLACAPSFALLQTLLEFFDFLGLTFFAQFAQKFRTHMRFMIMYKASVEKFHSFLSFAFLAGVRLDVIRNVSILAASLTH